MSLETDKKNADALGTVLDGFYDPRSGETLQYDRESEGALYRAISACVRTRLLLYKSVDQKLIDSLKGELDRIVSLRTWLVTEWRSAWGGEEDAPIGAVQAAIVRQVTGQDSDYIFEYLAVIAHRYGGKNASVSHQLFRLALNRLYVHLAGVTLALENGVVVPSTPIS